MLLQMQAFFLVADDVMDYSVTRRGQPCWYKKVRELLLLIVITISIMQNMIYHFYRWCLDSVLVFCFPLVFSVFSQVSASGCINIPCWTVLTGVWISQLWSTPFSCSGWPCSNTLQNHEIGPKMFCCFWSTVQHSGIHSHCLFVMHHWHWLSSVRVWRLLFCRAYETLAQRLRDSLGCKDCCANTNSLTYLLLYVVMTLQEEVGLIAVNDSFYLECTIYVLLRKHFRHLPCYTDLLDLFHDVSSLSLVHSCCSQVTNWMYFV